MLLITRWIKSCNETTIFGHVTINKTFFIQADVSYERRFEDTKSAVAGMTSFDEQISKKRLEIFSLFLLINFTSTENLGRYLYICFYWRLNMGVWRCFYLFLLVIIWNNINRRPYI